MSAAAVERTAGHPAERDTIDPQGVGFGRATTFNNT
ncbi:hypothetical protein FHT82_003720 [Rhizobium sp. BK275]|nr:hypothetical protein [Rhizobium sp. BK275]